MTSTTPEPAPTGYPARWRPRWAPEPEPEEPDPEIKPLAVEIWLASLDADEFDRVIKRARRNR